MKTVVIVNAGGWGALSAEKGSYDHFVELLREIVDAATVGVHGRDEKAAEVHVVRSVGEALEQLDGRAVQALVFVTRGMLDEARRIKHQRPKIRVVVLTGNIPDDDVIVVNKLWVLSNAQLKRMILDV